MHGSVSRVSQSRLVQSNTILLGGIAFSKLSHDLGHSCICRWQKVALVPARLML